MTDKIPDNVLVKLLQQERQLYNLEDQTRRLKAEMELIKRQLSSHDRMRQKYKNRAADQRALIEAMVKMARQNAFVYPPKITDEITRLRGSLQSTAKRGARSKREKVIEPSDARY